MKYREKTFFIIEYRDHYHTVVPWIKFLKPLNSIVFIDKSRVLNMESFLAEYSEFNEVEEVDNLIKQIFKSIFIKFQVPKLLITTAPEHMLSPYEILRLFFCSFLNPEIVCVRNPIEWSNKYTYRKSRPFKLKLLSKLSYLTLRHLAMRAKKIVCETKLQSEYFRQELNYKKSIFEFSGRLSDTPPIYLPKKPTTEKIVGLLGSVDTKRRNYNQLFEALEMLDINQRPKLIFLGSALNSSNPIIKKSQNLTEVLFYSTEFVTENEFFQWGSICTFLMSPLSESKEYGAKFGSGSFADAITLRKQIILPSYLKIFLEYSGFTITYDDSLSLSRVINSLDPLSEAESETIFNRYDLINTKKRLEVT